MNQTHRIFIMALFLVLSLQVTACSEQAEHISSPTQMQELPFYTKIVCEDNQTVTILDIGRSGVLFYSSHFEGASQFAYTDQIGLWDKEREQIVWTQTVDGKWLLCDGVLVDGEAYVSLLDCSRPEGGNWKLLRVTEETVETVDQGCSRASSGELAPGLARLSNGLAYSFETQGIGDQFSFGIKKVGESGQMEIIQKQDFSISDDQQARPLSLLLQSNGSAVAYFAEENGQGLFYVVNEKEVSAVPLEGKLYDFCLLKDYLVQSSQGENGRKTITVSNDIGERAVSENVYMPLFRQCSDNKNQFFAVDDSFNLYSANVRDGKATFEHVKVPLELTGRPVRIIFGEDSCFYLDYMPLSGGPESEPGSLYQLLDS